MGKLNQQQFRFRSNETLGAEGAEDDRDYLSDCFLDSGDLDVLRDTHDAKRIVVGRTGSGKTALLLALRTREAKVAWVEPDQLSLRYLSGCRLIRHLESIGVNLDLFYRLLWKHILVVELIKLKYPITNESDSKDFLAKILDRFFTDPRKKEALDYLTDWGDHFWETTETRVHEITERFTKKLEDSLNAKVGPISFDATGDNEDSLQTRREIVDRAQTTVNEIQIEKLARVIEVLASDVFSDQYPSYFVAIDRLDEDWTDEPVRVRLIRALLETVREFQKLRSVKVVVAIRQDLLDRVFRLARGPGFQEEKYQSLILKLRWDSESLQAVVERRLNKLVRRQYTKGAVEFIDIFPNKIDHVDAFKYMLARTLYRPRDIIQFANCCIEQAVNKPEITPTMIRAAEAEYSRKRFRSLGDEWIVDYPELLYLADLLKRRNHTFSISDVETNDLLVALGRNEASRPSVASQLMMWYREVTSGKMSAEDLRLKVFGVFYEVGLTGMRIDAQGMAWGFIGSNTVRRSELTDDTRVEIAPMFYRVLGVTPRRFAQVE